MKVIGRWLGVTMLLAVPAAEICAGETAESALMPRIMQAQSDVAAAQSELKTVRDRVDTERIPLQAEHRRLTADVREQRERLQRLQEAGRLETEQRQRLEREVGRLDDEVRFVMTALAEYRRGSETRMQAAERQPLRAALDRMDAALSETAAVAGGQAVSAVLEESVAWNLRRAGGYAFDGTALDAAGIEVKGRYLTLGPLVYFRGEAGDGALVTATPGSIFPSLFSGHKDAQRRAIAALVDGDVSASVPVDVSDGAALKRERAAESWIVEIQKGGFVMVPLLLTGILSLLIGTLKFIRLHALRRSVSETLAPVMDFVHRKDWGEAEEAARRLRPPLSELIGEALTHRHAAKEHLEEILHERLLSMTPAWESHLGTLAVFGGVAPLLGLLGTVTGMIHTFELVTLFGTGDARLLSGGISEALITTKFGLGIAIPVLVAHAFLVRRLRVITGTLEGKVARFANLLSGEAEA